MTICEYCSSIVARTDRDLTLRGKVSALMDTYTPFRIGATGVHRGNGFTIVGRTQIRHPAGGVWDEWYLAFDDGRWGWLAEAQGHLYLTFESRRVKAIPAFEDCQPGYDVELGLGGRWVIQEIGTGSFLSAAGELPFSFSPGENFRYADVVGTGGGFGTLDYGDDTPTAYIGREIRLADLHIEVREGYDAAGHIPAKSISCPKCGGPLTLRLPDLSQRVTCPNCDSLLDATAGNLRYLDTLPADIGGILIPPGSVGTLRGVEWTATGFMRRSCYVSGMTYHWDEYLLYNVEHGFRWLTQADGHWNFVEPVSAADIVAGATSASYKGDAFKRFQGVQGNVVAVVGEFYWKVSLGDTSELTDYIRPPLMLSREAAEFNDPDKRHIYAREVQWSLAHYLEGKDVFTAFQIKDRPPRRSTVGPNQPSPYKKDAKLYTLLGVLFSAVLAVVLTLGALSAKKVTVYEHTFRLPTPTAARGEEVVISEPFQLEDSRHAIQIDLRTKLNNSWFYLRGALINEKTGEAQMFEIENSFYHGVDDGYSWSEGHNQGSVTLSAMPAGTYVLSLAPERPNKRVRSEFGISVRTGIIRWIYPVLALVFFLVIPLFQWIRASGFEMLRWQESDRENA